MDSSLYDDGRGRMDGVGEIATKRLQRTDGAIFYSISAKYFMVSGILWPSQSRFGVFRINTFVGSYYSDYDQFLDYFLGCWRAFFALFSMG